jgi:hypothetical protein
VAVGGVEVHAAEAPLRVDRVEAAVEQPVAVGVGEHPLEGVAVVAGIAVAVAVVGGGTGEDLERAVAAVGDLRREAQQDPVAIALGEQVVALHRQDDQIGQQRGWRTRSGRRRDGHRQRQRRRCNGGSALDAHRARAYCDQRR